MLLERVETILAYLDDLAEKRATTSSSVSTLPAEMVQPTRVVDVDASRTPRTLRALRRFA